MIGGGAFWAHAVAYRAHTSTSGCMCTKTPLPCARHWFRMSLAALRLYNDHRIGDAVLEGAVVAGATPLFRCLVRHRGGLDVHAHPPSVGRSLPSSNLVREGHRSLGTGASRTWRLGLWPEPSGVPRPCSVMPDGRSVGERVIRRLEAALKPPSRVGIDGSGATPRDGGRGVKTHLRPNPYQALGLGGRSRPGQCCPCGADRPGREGARRGRVVAYSVARVRIAGGPKCASAPRVVCALQCGRKSRAGHR